MADPEYLAVQPREPAAERYVGLRQHFSTERVGVEAVRHRHRGDRVRECRIVLAEQRRAVAAAPYAHRAAGRLRQTLVPGEDRIEALFQQNPQGLDWKSIRLNSRH